MNIDKDRAIAVVGMGLVTALGKDLAQNWSQMSAGVPGAKEIRRFDTTNLKTRFAATVEGFDNCSNVERTAAVAEIALEEAMAAARLSADDRKRAAVFFGCPDAEIDWATRIAALELTQNGTDPAYSVRRRAEVYGESRNAAVGNRIRSFVKSSLPITSVTTACATGATAIQLAVEALRRGDIETAVVVASDAAASPDTISRFSLLSALSRNNENPSTASRPFDVNRDGFVMGEGAGATVLQRAETARSRGATVFGYVLGCGSATDIYHKTKSDPSGKAVTQSMANALSDAGLSAGDIDWINAHGTSTRENDFVESIAINSIFKATNKDVLVTSNKSMLGHTLCAAGIVEAVASLLSMKHGLITPTINLSSLDPKIELNVATKPERRATRTVLSNSLGFGGQNMTLVLGSSDYFD